MLTEGRERGCMKRHSNKSAPVLPPSGPPSPKAKESAPFASTNTGSPKFLSFNKFETICILHGISTATARLLFSEIRQKLRAGA